MATQKINIVRLGERLWEWSLCAKCQAGDECQDRACPGRRHHSLQRYYQFCEAVLHPDPLDHSFTTNFLRGKDDHSTVINSVKSNPELTRVDLRAIVWGNNNNSNSSMSTTNMSATMNRAIRVMFMVDCAPLQQPSERLEEGQSRLCWGDDQPLSQFLEETFPKQQHHILSSINHPHRMKLRGALRADRLRKRLGVTFRGTSDLRDHLRLSYTSRGMVLNIYHYAGFVKEQLVLTKAAARSESFSESIHVSGTVPRQLMLEVLDSLQGILFPVASKKARKLLDRLVATENWDSETRIYEYSTLRNRDEDSIAYVYFAERLSQLQDELDNPPPRGWLEKQMERRTANRYMMMATLAGVAFAVLLGILSLAVSSYQTWISYQAWQHPVSSG